MKEQDYIEIKVLIGNLLNCFPTNRIRNKDMARYNQELNDVIKDIETRVNASPSDNNDFKICCLDCSSKNIELTKNKMQCNDCGFEWTKKNATHLKIINIIGNRTKTEYKMNRKIGIIGYIATMILCAYLTFCDALVLFMQSLGMKIVVYHPLLGFKEGYGGEFTIIPNIIEFLYLLITWIFFAIIGWKKIRATADNNC